MYRFLSKSGRLLLGENRYQAIRKQVFRWIRGGKRKKYAKIRKEFFRQSRHKEEYQNIYRARTTHLVTIDQPLVLISQVARSGGTLLKRLFDNHQQCHVYPVELAMGIRPDVYDYAWPLLDLTSDSHAWLKSLVQIHIWRWLNDDFRYWLSEKESHPLIILPLLCERIFLDCVSKRIIKSDRDVFDCYMTALFNSWIDNQNLYSTIPKKYVVAFAPKMGLEHDNIKRFFLVYPDGVYISIIRDPRNWYASALNYRTWEFNDLDASFQSQWNKSTQLALDIWRERPNQVVLISFEDLIQNTEGTMKYLSHVLGISFVESMLIPSFNGRHIKANSSFKGKKEISDATLHRYREALSPQQIERIEQISMPLFEVAMQAIREQRRHIVWIS